MDYEEFRGHLTRAGVSGAEFARLLKKHPNTISNYARCGRVPDHLSVAVVLMAELAGLGVDPRVVLERVGITAAKPRGSRQFGSG